MSLTRLGHLRLARPEDDEMKDSELLAPKLFSILVAVLAVVGVLVLLTKLVYVKARPAEPTPITANVPARADVKVDLLLKYDKIETGVSRVVVDGRTFLVVHVAGGVAIVEYEPVVEEPGE